MELDKIIVKLNEAINNRNAEGFLSLFMDAYGYSRTSISRTINGTGAIAHDGVYDRKKDFLIRFIDKTPFIEKTFQESLEEAHNKERFVIVTDFDKLLAKDMKTKEGISIAFKDLPDHYEFFNPLRGIEKLDIITENAVDVKAAQKMSALFDEIQKTNPCTTTIERHAMNVFLNRLLFCYFADDTNIFSDGQFINSVHQNTEKDGSDLSDYLKNLFHVLNTPEKERNCGPCYKHFPYVNGGLFRDEYPIPNFNAKSRQHLIECGEFNWSAINPDIFGSMFQTVVDPQHRSELGQHYTSVTNIMKVLNPLFIDDLREELDNIIAIADENSSSALRMKKDKKLDEFRVKLTKIKVFDPACGSGNFLITAYKEICHLEMKAIEEYFQKVFPTLSIEINHFYGIEIDDFPAEVAKLSLWLTQHQMNMECAEVGIETKPTLPLQEAGHIVCANALTTPWEEVCPYNEGDIVYIAGNPPFTGGQSLDDDQREQKNAVLEGCPNVGYADLVSAWFLLSAKYINKHQTVRVGLVSTNSIYQGIQVGIWGLLKELGVKPFFAYQPFKWSNNASNKAGVIVTITGLMKDSLNDKKYIYSDSLRIEVSNIGPYMAESDIIVSSHNTPICMGIPLMLLGSCFADGGNLILSKDERDLLLNEYPNSAKFIHLCIGSQEFIRGEQRWCLWINEEDLYEAKTIPFINSRIEKVKEFRLASKKKGTREKANIPWAPTENRYRKADSIFLPRDSSSSREYIPMGFLDANSVVNSPNFAVYGAPIWLFGLMESKMHMAWIKIVCGRLKTDYRYSVSLGYNSFPFPSISDEKKNQLESTARGILMAREENYEMTLAQQYAPDKMPAVLRAAHDANDMLVDSLYNPQGFANDEERLNELFKRYSKLVEKEGR